MMLPNPYGPMTCRWILLGQKGFLINGTLYFPYCRGRILHPLFKTCFLHWSLGQDQVATAQPARCVYSLPAPARCLNQQWPSPIWRCQLSWACEAPVWDDAHLSGAVLQLTESSAVWTPLSWLHAAGRYRKSRVTVALQSASLVD